VPVVPAGDVGRTTPVKLNVPDTLEDVSDVMVTVPLPNCPPAPHTPVTVVPFVVWTVIESVPCDTAAVPTEAGPAHAIARVRSALLDAMFTTPLMFVARLTVPVYATPSISAVTVPFPELCPPELLLGAVELLPQPATRKTRTAARLIRTNKKG